MKVNQLTKEELKEVLYKNSRVYETRIKKGKKIYQASTVQHLFLKRLENSNDMKTFRELQRLNDISRNEARIRT